MKIAVMAGLLTKWYVDVDSGHFFSDQLSFISYQLLLIYSSRF